LFEPSTDTRGNGFFARGELCYETDFLAVGVAADQAVYDGGSASFGVGEAGSYGIYFDVFLVVRGEERFVDVGSF